MKIRIWYWWMWILLFFFSCKGEPSEPLLGDFSPYEIKSEYSSLLRYGPGMYEIEFEAAPDTVIIVEALEVPWVLYRVKEKQDFFDHELFGAAFPYDYDVGWCKFSIVAPYFLEIAVSKNESDVDRCLEIEFEGKRSKNSFLNLVQKRKSP